MSSTAPPTSTMLPAGPSTSAIGSVEGHEQQQQQQQRERRSHDKLHALGKSAIPARLPLAPKNTIPQPHAPDAVFSTKGVSSGSSNSEKHSVTPQQQQQQQRILQAKLLASGAALSSNSSGTPVPHKHASYLPSPLGALYRDDATRASMSQLAVANTPRKRTAPFDEIHQCRLASRIIDTSSTESPHSNSNKRSRSSKPEGSMASEVVGTSASNGSSGLVAPIQATLLTDSPNNSQERAAGGNAASCIREQVTESYQAAGSASSQNVRKSLPSNPPPRPKTTRIDKQSRMTDADRQRREQASQASKSEWRRRFIRAFPGFRFYLDGFDAASKDDVTSAIEKLGASVDPFFSNTVTHLVTARKVSLPLPTEGNSLDARDVKTADGASSSRSTSLAAATLRKKHVQVPLHSDRNPFEDSGPPVSSNDILVKARNFGIKVWSFDKFQTIIRSLIGEAANATDDRQQQQLNLSQMLEKEKLQGSLDRDPNAARNDYHYFSRNSIYLLIEDSTAEHRPIMLQEWAKPAAGTSDEKVPWPILYGDLEGKCPFTKHDYEGDPQKRIKPNRHESLRRTVSLNHMRLHQQRVASLSPAPSGDSRGGYAVARDASPYPLASGNSMSIASGIASTTSTAFGSHTGSTAGVGLLSPFGPLGKQINQTSGIGLGRPSVMPSNIGTPRQGLFARRLSPFTDRSRGEQMPGSLMRRSFAVPRNPHSQFALNRSTSTPNAGESAQRERERKPGFCENCRVKYEDFEEHIAGRRHRKFARDDANFAEIDDLLNRISRPLAAWASASVSNSISQSPDSSQTHADDGHGSVPVTSPSSSLIAAGASLDEAYGEDRDLAVVTAREAPVEITMTQASLQSVKDNVASWQQGTAEFAGVDSGEKTFIDHEAYLVSDDEDQAR